MSVRPQSFFDFIEIWHARRVMHDSMQNDPIQGQGHKPFKIGNPAIFNCYLCHLQWELAIDNWFLNYGIYVWLDQICYICLSLCVTWLWTWQKRQLRRVDRQSRTGLIFFYVLSLLRSTNVLKFALKTCSWNFFLWVGPLGLTEDRFFVLGGAQIRQPKWRPSRWGVRVIQFLLGWFSHCCYLFTVTNSGHLLSHVGLPSSCWAFVVLR